MTQTALPHTTLFKPSPDLRKQLNRHTKKSLLEVVQSWLDEPTDTTRPQFSDDQDLDDGEAIAEPRTIEELVELYGSMEGANKKAVVDRVYERDWRTGLTCMQIAQLDHKYHTTGTPSRQWTAMRLVFPDTREGKRPSLTATSIERGLSTWIAPFTKHHIYIVQDTESLWMRLMLFDSLPTDLCPPSNHIIYMIWFSNFDYLLMSGGKAEWATFLTQAILRTFDASGLEKVQLKGKQTDSLRELLLNSNSLGTFTKYRLGKVDGNPLLPPSKRPRYDDTIGEDYVDAENSMNIMMEDNDIKTRRDAQVGDIYGREEQPKMEKLEFQLSLPFPSHDVYSLSDAPDVSIRLDGAHLIDGLRRMLECGIADDSGPEWLWDSMSMQKNIIHVDQDGVRE